MSKNVEFKEISFEFKKVSDDGDFEGHLSVFDNVDSYNDIVHSGAYKKTLREQKKFPFLWQHDRYNPIGSFTGKEDDIGLFVKGRLNLMTTVSGIPKVPKAHEAHALMLNGDVTGLSIGFDALQYDFTTDKKNGKVRHLREIRLWEGSLVVFPANDVAKVTNVKTMLAYREVQKLLEQGILTKEQLLALLDQSDNPAGLAENIERSVTIPPEWREAVKDILNYIKEV